MGVIRSPGNRKALNKGISASCWILMVANLLVNCRSFQLQPLISHQTSSSPLQVGSGQGKDTSNRGPPSRGIYPAGLSIGAELNSLPVSRRRVVIGSTVETDDGVFENDRRYRRKPRRGGLRRDDAGLPTEKVYAPRISVYGKPTATGGSGGTKRVRPQGEERDRSLNNAAKLRVAGGVVKGRRLESPDVFLRPMMGKVKEALFSTLTGFGVFETGNARFLDLFSGSGSVGVEALSRGAGHATFVDFAKDCCEVSLRNALSCGFADQANAVRGDVFDVLYNPRKFGLDAPYDVVVVTPPYEEVVYGDLVKALAASDLVTRDTIVVLEYPVELGCLPQAIGEGSMVGLRNRRYGRTVIGVWVYLPTGQHDDLLDARPEEFCSHVEESPGFAAIVIGGVLGTKEMGKIRAGSTRN